MSNVSDEELDKQFDAPVRAELRGCLRSSFCQSILYGLEPLTLLFQTSMIGYPSYLSYSLSKHPLRVQHARRLSPSGVLTSRSRTPSPTCCLRSHSGIAPYSGPRLPFDSLGFRDAHVGPGEAVVGLSVEPGEGGCDQLGDGLRFGLLAVAGLRLKRPV